MYKIVIKKKPLKEANVRAVTQTPKFKNWFGKSVIKDENGNPQVLYHGTTREFFDSFSPGVVGSLGAGIYLTSDNEMANAYSSGAIGKAALSKSGSQGSAKSYPVYVKAEKPLVLNTSDSFSDEQIEEKIKLAKQKGIDSIIINSGNEKFVEVVVFQPTQVKSAVGNAEFDPSNPEMVNEKKV